MRVEIDQLEQEELECSIIFSDAEGMDFTGTAAWRRLLECLKAKT